MDFNIVDFIRHESKTIDELLEYASNLDISGLYSEDSINDVRNLQASIANLQDQGMEDPDTSYQGTEKDIDYFLNQIPQMNPNQSQNDLNYVDTENDYDSDGEEPEFSDDGSGIEIANEPIDMGNPDTINSMGNLQSQQPVIQQQQMPVQNPYQMYMAQPPLQPPAIAPNYFSPPLSGQIVPQYTPITQQYPQPVIVAPQQPQMVMQPQQQLPISNPNTSQAYSQGIQQQQQIPEETPEQIQDPNTIPSQDGEEELGNFDWDSSNGGNSEDLEMNADSNQDSNTNDQMPTEDNPDTLEDPEDSNEMPEQNDSNPEEQMDDDNDVDQNERLSFNIDQLNTLDTNLSDLSGKVNNKNIIEIKNNVSTLIGGLADNIKNLKDKPNLKELNDMIENFITDCVDEIQSIIGVAQNAKDAKEDKVEDAKSITKANAVNDEASTQKDTSQSF